jgi:hypothetical protein
MNYGITWIASTSPSGQYATIACSASGQYQVAATGAGTVYYSSTYGQSWSASNMSTVGSLQDSAMSASGQYVSIATNAVGVWYSSNYGQTFVQVTAVIGTFNLRQIAMNASGQYQLVSGFTGGMYYSTNYGVNWTQGSSSVAWYSVAISANGQYCVGCIYGGAVYQSVTRSPSLYTSGSVVVNGNVQSGTYATNDFIIGTAATSYTTGKWLTLGLNNVQGNYPTAGYGVSSTFSIGGNFTNGSSEVAFMNNNGQGFNFYNRTGTSSSSLLMVIRGDGNVGIGLTNPAYLLHVSNAGSAAFGAANGTSGYGTNTGTITAPVSSGQATGATSTNNYGTVLNILGGTLSTGAWNNANFGGDIVLQAGDMIDSGNNGTASGTYAGGGIFLRSGRVAVNNQAGNVQTVTPGPIYFQIGSGSRNNPSAFGGYNTAMMIDSNGNVGIGTNAPSQPLEVYKNNGVGTVTQMNITSIAGGVTTTNQSILNLKIQGAGGGTVDNIIIGQYNGSGAGTYALSFNPGGTNVMNVLASGNVGIGTTNPSTILHLFAANNTITADWATSRANGNEYVSAGIDSYFLTRDLIQNLGGFIRILDISTNGSFPTAVRGGAISFGTINGGTGFGGNPAVERMRIIPDGNVGIGITNPGSKLTVNGDITTTQVNVNTISSTAGNNLNIYSASNDINFFTNGTNSIYFRLNSLGAAFTELYNNHQSGVLTGASYQLFQYNGVNIGSISQLGTSNISFNTNSDRRLKNSISRIPNPINTLKKLKPVTFNWIADNIQDVGYIADEFQEVFPLYVQGNKDQVDSEGKPKYQSMSDKPCSSLLVACVQDQQVQIETLTAQIAILQQQVAALLAK